MLYSQVLGAHFIVKINTNRVQKFLRFQMFGLPWNML
jgi:hypothetical protein